MTWPLHRRDDAELHVLRLRGFTALCMDAVILKDSRLAAATPARGALAGRGRSTVETWIRLGGHKNVVSITFWFQDRSLKALLKIGKCAINS